MPLRLCGSVCRERAKRKKTTEFPRRSKINKNGMYCSRTRVQYMPFLVIREAAVKGAVKKIILPKFLPVSPNPYNPQSLHPHPAFPTRRAFSWKQCRPRFCIGVSACRRALSAGRCQKTLSSGSCPKCGWLLFRCSGLQKWNYPQCWKCKWWAGGRAYGC